MYYLVNIIIYDSIPYTNQFIINKENLVNLPLVLKDGKGDIWSGNSFGVLAIPSDKDF